LEIADCTKPHVFGQINKIASFIFPEWHFHYCSSLTVVVVDSKLDLLPIKSDFFNIWM
jgi:hypothetical protein